MKTIKSLYSIIFASVTLILFLIFVSSAASAASFKVTETQITCIIKPENTLSL